MAAPKGHRPPKAGVGRKKGVPNKVTQSLRTMIEAALNGQPGGGVKYLKEQAVAQPAAFLTLLGKILPMQVAGDPNNPLVVEIVQFARQNPE